METRKSVNHRHADGSESTSRPEAVTILRQIAELAIRLSDEMQSGQSSTDRSAFDREPDERTIFRFNSPSRDSSGFGDGDLTKGSVRASRPPLPDPRLVRRIIRQRQLRGRYFDGELFADPAWDMLLDLTAARAEHTRVSVTSLCIASGVPPTTALRWISQMTEAGLLTRVDDDSDRRRAFIALTDRAADAMARYFAESGPALAISAGF